ncbi:hypothetical protein [Nocardioides sp. LS1]|uniref:hypothetical protein n=1 Tax=Nocardioides sp. LS1 TaxID=1027620 RepID=UPI000F617CA7|nr:hypothetical protein [Nocardioides sp. LS1]GCD89958.1 hypothetical protein NLS1_19640 [Nocardioides sp. LS1]
MSSLLHRILLALDCDPRPGAHTLAGGGTVTACAALGSVVGNVATMLLRDRRLVSTWLDEHAQASR